MKNSETTLPLSRVLKSGTGHCILFPGFQKTKGLSSKWSCREPYGCFWKSHVLLNTEWECLVWIHCQQCGLWDWPKENVFTASPYWCSTAISAYSLIQIFSAINALSFSNPLLVISFQLHFFFLFLMKCISKERQWNWCRVWSTSLWGAAEGAGAV